MGSSANKDLCAAWLDAVFNTKDLSAGAGYLAEDFVDENPFPGSTGDREGTLGTMGMLHQAFPDIRVDVVDSIEDGDKVLVRERFTGTHQGEFMGAPASGKSAMIESLDIMTIRDGKIVRHAGVFDAMGLMMQLGMIPTPDA